jgi:predicted MPP superfamily phosphohydrolase
MMEEKLKAYAGRLGERHFRQRLNIERRLSEGRGKGQGKGLFWLERKMDVYGFIRLCLRVSGIWKRTQRNYLDIHVKAQTVRLPELPSEFEGYTILQLSDLHADLHPDFPAKVKEVIAPLKYDCIALTGDFRTATFGDHSGATEATIDIVSETKLPVYAVLGNHDWLVKVPALEAADIRFFLNENLAIRRGDSEIYLVGIDDPNFYRTHDFERALRGVPDSAIKILLSHSPQTYAEAAAHGFDYLMAGHTHGGQICLPGGRVIVHDKTAPRKVLAGSWTEGKMQGYTSRGTGACGLPSRLNCPAEVTLHTLTKLP